MTPGFRSSSRSARDCSSPLSNKFASSARASKAAPRFRFSLPSQGPPDELYGCGACRRAANEEETTEEGIAEERLASVLCGRWEMERFVKWKFLPLGEKMRRIAVLKGFARGKSVSF